MDKRQQQVVMLALVVSVLVISIFTGCQSAVNPDGSPTWTAKVPLTTSIYYATGYGKLTNVQNSLMRAESLAKDRIGRWVSTKVQGALTNFFQDTGNSGGQTVEMLENISRQIVDVSINEARLVEQWIAPDGGVWVLYSYPVKNLKDAYRLKSEELERQSEAVQAKMLLEYLETELENK